MLSEEWKMTVLASCYMKFHMLVESLHYHLYQNLRLRAVQIAFHLFFTALCDCYCADIFTAAAAPDPDAAFVFALARPTYLALTGLLTWQVDEEDI